MREQIKILESKAKLLEPAAEERKKIRKEVIDYTESFLDEIDDLDKRPTYFKTSTGEEIEDMEPGPATYPIEEIVQNLGIGIDESGLNPASGGHLGYIPGGGLFSSALGDYWAAITNRYAGMYFANPGAVRVENKLIKWMAKHMGYPEQAAGNLTSGGSIANLTAVVTAREAKGIASENMKSQVIYLSEQAHHCVPKAIAIAGLKECPVRMVKLTAQFKMDTDHLKELIHNDLTNGLTPFLLVASAGTTDTGAIDPLVELASIARSNNIWFHVDAAYGGFFNMTSEGRKKLRGIEESDSLVIDPHKGLFLPYGIGVVLIKDRTLARQAFTHDASYLQDTKERQEELSPADVSPELTKHFRGLRLWIPLLLHGEAPFIAGLEEKLLLTKYAYNKLKEDSQFEVGPEPELSVFTFRYLPESGDINQANADLIRLIHEDGRVFLSSTRINNEFWIRMAILSFRTHIEIIDLTLEILKEKAKLVGVEKS